MGDNTIMPYEVEDIRLFNKGIVGAIDSTDSDKESVAWSLNVDSQGEVGSLTGMPHNTFTSNSASPLSFKDGAIIQKTIDSTLKNVLVYSGEVGSPAQNAILINDSIVDAEGNSTNGLSGHSLIGTGTVFTSQNDACYIGTGNNPPIWTGYYKEGLQLNGVITQSGTGLNDIAIDVVENSLSAVKSFKARVTNTSTFKLLDIYIVSGDPVYDTFIYNLNGQGIDFVLNDNVHITGERIMYPENPNDPIWSSSIDLTTTVTHLETINGVRTVKFNNFSSLQLESGYSSLEQTTRVRIIKSPNDKSYYDIINWNSDSANDPTYGTTNRVFIPKNDFFDLSDNFKMKFLSETGHALNNMWTMVVNPIKDSFLVEEDRSVISHEFTANTLFTVGGSSWSDLSPTGVFQTGKQLIYGISFIYDFLTESPIYTNSSLRFIPNESEEGNSHTLTWYFNGGNFAKRVTGFNIYFGLGELGNAMPSGYFRLLKAYTIAPNEEVQLSSGGAYFVVVKNTNAIGASYEAGSGISQDIDNFRIKYTYATKLDNQLFVAKCYHTDIPNAERMIFRSKTFRLHMFDWVNEYLVLDYIPKAICSAFGKIFVFGENKVTRINGTNFFIEDETEGIGILSNKHVKYTDFGLFWADKNHVYQFDGNKITKISFAIQHKLSLNDNTYISRAWADFATECTSLLYDTKRRSLVFIDINSGYSEGFVYDLESNRWDFVLFGIEPRNLLITGLTYPDGYIRFFADIAGDNTPGVLKLFSNSSSKHGFQVWTKKMDLGSAGVDKIIRRIKINYTESGLGNPSISYRLDSDTTWTSLIGAHLSPRLSLKAKTIQLKITGGEGCKISSLSIIYRKLRVN